MQIIKHGQIENKSSIDFELQILLDKGINYINQFMTFEDFDSGNSKLDTIKCNKLYAGFSWGFNDIFDSQLRLSFSDRIELFQKIINHYSLVGINITYLDNIRTMLHLMNISCFTELDPLNLKSDNMWGLYAKSATGICIQYKIDDIKNFLSSDNHQPWIIKKVQYVDSIDKPKIFEDLVTVAKTPELNNPEEVKKHFQLFHCSKLTTWCTEKEWRFISPINIQPYFNRDLSKYSVYPPYEAIRDGHYSHPWFNK